MSTRLNIQFSDNQKKSLEEMAKELGTTQAGVIKKAISLLNVTIRERSKHNDIAFVDKEDKVTKHIVGIFD